MSPTTGGYEEQPTIHGRIAMRVDEAATFANGLFHLLTLAES